MRTRASSEFPRAISHCKIDIVITMLRNVKLYLIPAVILLAVTLPHLEQGEYRRDTVRYAAIGLHMWQDGSLLTPYLNPEKPFFNKPPMAFWIHGLFLKIFGTDLAMARLPSILAALGVLVFSMLAVRNLATRREAVVSGIILALTYEFFRRTREISLDFWQLFFIMAAVWLVTKTIRSGHRWPVIVSGIPIGLALLCKPLVALVALPIFAIWLVLTGRARLIGWIFLAALPLAILIAAPWHLYMYSSFGHRFLKQYFVHEVVERAQRSDQPTSIFYYLNENLRTYWPWMIGLVGAGYFRIKQRRPRTPRRDLVRLALLWVGIWLIALSLFPDRKPNYALPLYPMLSWITAWGLCRIRSPKLKAWYEKRLTWLAPGFAVAGVILALAPIQFQKPPEENWVALVNWIRDKHIDATQLAYANIDQNDVCYIYLKTGKWMKSLPAAQAGGGPQQPDLLLVTKLTGEQKRQTHGEVLFVSGPVHVISVPRP